MCSAWHCFRYRVFLMFEVLGSLYFTIVRFTVMIRFSLLPGTVHVMVHKITVLITVVGYPSLPFITVTFLPRLLVQRCDATSVRG